MKWMRFVEMLAAVGVLGLLSISARAQQQAAIVPTLVNFSGTLTDVNGKPLTGTVGVTFYLYKDEQGGSPLWTETQNLQPDASGHFSVMLGATTSQGLPTGLFASGEARWLGVQAQGQAEQPRVVILSVPYALKAGDAQTVGGLPPSAFVLAAPVNTASGSAPTSTSSDLPPTLGGSGTLDFVPLWTPNGNTLGNSVLFQSGTGSTAKVGVNTTTPATTLDVKGAGTIRGTLSIMGKATLSAIGTATATAGKNSQPEDFTASAFNSGSNAAVNQTFQLQAEPAGNDTSSPSGTLNLLFGSGTSSPTETGLHIASNGQITFASGQTFPGTGNGTITGVTAGTSLLGGGTSGNVTLNVDTTKVVTGVTAGADLTGGGTGGSVTLSLDTTKVPQLSAANTFSANQTINANLTDNGNITATGAVAGQTGSFSGNNTSQVLNVIQAGTGSGIAGTVPSSNSLIPAAILGSVTGSNGFGYGLEGVSSATDGTGVFGTSNFVGVQGSTGGTFGQGVFGYAASVASGSTAEGVRGTTNGDAGIGVEGEATSEGTSAIAIGVRGYSYAPYGNGVYGYWSNPSTSGVGSMHAGVWGDSSTGYGILGTSDSETAVFGSSPGYVGVVGNSGTYEGVYGAGPYGVFGYGISTAGTYGQFSGRSSSGSGWANVGSWGDSGCSGCVGVLGTVDDGNALFGINNTVNHETLYVANNSGFNGGTPSAARFAGPGASTYCYIPRDSNDNGTGDLVCTGTKSAAVPVDGDRMVRLYAVEAAENWFEDAGSGQLTNGVALIALDQTFGQTVNGDLDYHVFLTPNGDCEGLYVTNKTGHGFEVHELHGGHSSIAFDFRIMVRRKGFEKVRMQDVTADFAQMRHESETLAAKIETNNAKEKIHPSFVIPGMPKKSSYRMPPPSKPPMIPQHIVASTISTKK